MAVIGGVLEEFECRKISRDLSMCLLCDRLISDYSVNSLGQMFIGPLAEITWAVRGFAQSDRKVSLNISSIAFQHRLGRCNHKTGRLTGSQCSPNSCL